MHCLSIQCTSDTVVVAWDCDLLKENMLLSELFETHTHTQAVIYSEAKILSISFHWSHNLPAEIWIVHIWPLSLTENNRSIKMSLTTLAPVQPTIEPPNISWGFATILATVFYWLYRVCSYRCAHMTSFLFTCFNSSALKAALQFSACMWLAVSGTYAASFYGILFHLF